MFKTHYITFVLLFVTFFANIEKIYSQELCENLFDTPKSINQIQFQSDFIPQDLLTFYNNSVSNKNFVDIMFENGALIEAVNQYTPPKQSQYRAQNATYYMTRKILNLAQNHPVIGHEGSRKYQKPGVEIGYCFGRAMYIHLLLLKLGIQKESIKKIWTLGPAKTNVPNVTWAFHVATMVYTSDRGWIVLDTSSNDPMTLNEWTTKMFETSIDQKMKFIVTDANRFTPSNAKYNPIQLGMKLTREKDFYSHYFHDMFASLKTEDVSWLSVKPKVTVSNKTIKDDIQQLETSVSQYFKNLLNFFR